MKRSGSFLIGLALIGLACWPVTTRFGVDYRWSSRRITLFEKAVHFLSRDLQTRRLVAELTRGARGADEKLLRLFDWTVVHVRATPPGLPVVDDHPWHIIVRGYGAPDQRAEALALLASYAGFRAAAAALYAPGTDHRILVTVVRDGSRTFVFDVNNDIAFRKGRNALADVREVAANPDLIPTAARSLTIDGVPYERYLAGLASLAPGFQRMEAQKPWPRLKQELSHRLAPRPPAEAGR